MKPSKYKDALQTDKPHQELKTVMSSHDRFFVLVFLGLGLLMACGDQTDAASQEVYEGPLLIMDSVDTKMSDSGKIVMKLKAPKQLNFENGDREWPESLYLEYLDKEGNITSTFKADYVIYKGKDELYHAKGNVVVNNAKDGDELNTEELFWNPVHEEFYTERFVTIQSEGEVHTGEGLRADQDFSTYKILKPQGTLNLEDQK